MNDRAYLYANTSDKSIMYDLAVHCALVEVPPVPGGGLKRILSSSPSPSRSRFEQRLRSSGGRISCCLIPRAGGTGSRPAALEGMVLGEGDAGLGGLGRGRGAVGRAVGSRRTGMEPGVGG